LLGGRNKLLPESFLASACFCQLFVDVLNIFLKLLDLLSHIHVLSQYIVEVPLQIVLLVNEHVNFIAGLRLLLDRCAKVKFSIEEVPFCANQLLLQCLHTGFKLIGLALSGSRDLH
jgi:hypothetical protein